MSVPLPSSKKDWVLTSDAFDQLLLYLDRDRERAAEKYEDLRQMLITFFEFRSLMDPEDHADETINRVARRLSEGEQIFTASPNTYLYAVARNVWREQLAKPAIIISPVDELPQARALADDPVAQSRREARRAELEERLDCLEECLAKLPPESRELVTSYYRGEKDAKIKARKELAERHGIQLNALRIRVCRLRDKLDRCVRNCLQRLPRA